MAVGGRDLSVRVFGDPAGASPIVLVHGLGVSGRYLLPTARLLAGRHPVYVPDLLGFGASARPRHVLSLAEHADVLAEWMEARGLARAEWVGNSAGCQVLVELVLRHPGRVRSLVLTGPTVDRHARSLGRQLVRLLLDGTREPLGLTAIVFADYLSAGPRRLLQTAQALLSDPIEEKLPRVDVPTLVVRGERDPFAPQRWAEEVTRLLPRGRLVVLPGAPHAVNYAAAPALAREIIAFLEETRTSCPDRRRP